MHPSRLDEYLDRLSEPVTVLSAREQQEWREEARQHLLCLAAAYEELGSSPEEALEAALRQFGDARQIGRRLDAAERHRQGRLFTPAGLCAIGALLAYGGNRGICVLAVPLLGNLHVGPFLQWGLLVGLLGVVNAVAGGALAWL